MNHTRSGDSLVLLLARSDSQSRLSQADALIAAGFSVIEVVSTDEALSYLESRADIQLIVVDADMPGCFSGLALARFVSRRWPRIPILVLGWPSEPTPSMSQTIAFIPEPHTPSALVEQARMRLGLDA